MKKLSDYIGQTLKLVEPSMLKGICELRAGEEVLAVIRSPKIFGSMMEIKGSFGSWEIYRPNFWKSLIAIRQAGFELPIAEFDRKIFSSKGTLKLPKGENLFIVFYPFKKYFEVKNSYDERIVVFTPKFSWGGEKVELSIEKKSELLDKYPWVLMLVWYLAAQRKRAHAAAVAH